MYGNVTTDVWKYGNDNRWYFYYRCKCEYNVSMEMTTDVNGSMEMTKHDTFTTDVNVSKTTTDDSFTTDVNVSKTTTDDSFTKCYFPYWNYNLYSHLHLWVKRQQMILLLQM